MARVLIYKDEVLKTLEKERHAKNGSLVHMDYEDVIDIIEHIPAAVSNMPKWIVHEEGPWAECSCCGYPVNKLAIGNQCPKCLALLAKED